VLPSWSEVLRICTSLDAYDGKQGLSQSVHTSKRQLKEFLLNYIVQNNKSPKPFVWTKGPKKLQRIIEATKEYHAAHPRKLRKRRG
jgi:hypothetical protein